MNDPCGTNPRLDSSLIAWSAQNERIASASTDGMAPLDGVGRSFDRYQAGRGMPSFECGDQFVAHDVRSSTPYQQDRASEADQLPFDGLSGVVPVVALPRIPSPLPEPSGISLALWITPRRRDRALRPGLYATARSRASSKLANRRSAVNAATLAPASDGTRVSFGIPAPGAESTRTRRSTKGDRRSAVSSATEQPRPMPTRTDDSGAVCRTTEATSSAIADTPYSWSLRQSDCPYRAGLPRQAAFGAPGQACPRCGRSERPRGVGRSSQANRPIRLRSSFDRRHQRVGPRHLWFAIPCQPGIFSAVDQKRKLVFFRAHSARILGWNSQGTTISGRTPPTATNRRWPNRPAIHCFVLWDHLTSGERSNDER